VQQSHCPELGDEIVGFLSLSSSFYPGLAENREEEEGEDEDEDEELE